MSKKEFEKLVDQAKEKKLDEEAYNEMNEKFMRYFLIDPDPSTFLEELMEAFSVRSKVKEPEFTYPDYPDTVTFAQMSSKEMSDRLPDWDIILSGRSPDSRAEIMGQLTAKEEATKREFGIGSFLRRIASCSSTDTELKSYRYIQYLDMCNHWCLTRFGYVYEPRHTEYTRAGIERTLADGDIFRVTKGILTPTRMESLKRINSPGKEIEPYKCHCKTTKQLKDILKCHDISVNEYESVKKISANNAKRYLHKAFKFAPSIWFPIDHLVGLAQEQFQELGLPIGATLAQQYAIKVLREQSGYSDTEAGDAYWENVRDEVQPKLIKNADGSLTLSRRV